jgi:hypothetical protein
MALYAIYYFLKRRGSLAPKTRMSFSTLCIDFPSDLAFLYFPDPSIGRLPLRLSRRAELEPYRTTVLNENEANEEPDVDSVPSPIDSPKKEPLLSMGTQIKKSTHIVSDNCQNDIINQARVP